jgi:uncharacterized protein (TIGR00730 family)
MKKICVYCGSSFGDRPDYRRAAEQLGTVLAESGFHLVYGGGGVGLMGVVANAALDSGGQVTGIITQGLVAIEAQNPRVDDMRVMTSMHERKKAMADLADAFIVLPGGFGTFEEMFEILTWAQLDIHRKPVGLLNISGYYDHLIDFMQYSVAEGFVKDPHFTMLQVGADPVGLLDQLAQYRYPVVSKL